MGSAAVSWESFLGIELGDEASRFRPMPSKLLVKADPPEEKTKGGIYKPDTAIKRSQTGIVVKVGENCRPELKPGVKVFMSYWAANAIELDGIDYLLYLEKDIGGVLTEPLS